MLPDVDIDMDISAILHAFKEVGNIANCTFPIRQLGYVSSETLYKALKMLEFSI